MQFENVISSNLPSRRKILSTLPRNYDAADEFKLRFPALDNPECVQLIVRKQLGMLTCASISDRRTEPFLVIIDAVAFEFLVAERQRSLAASSADKLENCFRR